MLEATVAPRRRFRAGSDYTIIQKRLRRKKQIAQEFSEAYVK